MDNSTGQTDKKARYEEYCNTYSEQLRLLGFIKTLETDNESIRRSEAELGGGTRKAARRARKLIKINDKDIKKYNKMLKAMPEVPPFK